MIRWLVPLLALAVPAAARASEVVLWHSYREAEQTALEHAAQAWAKETGNTVQVVAVPFGAFDSKVETAIPRGNGPDLFVAAHGGLGQWAQMGIVVPWTGDPALYDTLRPKAVQAVTWRGKRYGAPLALKSLLLLYDPTVIDTQPKTTDELIALAKAHTGSGHYGLAYQAGEAYFFAPWVHAFGGDPFAGGEVDLDTPAEARAYALTRRLAVDEGIAPLDPTASLVARLYRDGDAAFVISGPWFLADIQGRPIAAAPLPVVSEAGRPARPYLTVDTAFVAAHAGHPDLATRLAAFLAGPEGAKIRQDEGRQAVTLRGAHPDDPLLKVQLAQADQAVVMPTDPRAASVWEAQARALRRVLRGAATPEEAAREAQDYYRVLQPRKPAPADPRPYLALAAVVLLGLLGWFGHPLLDAEVRHHLRAHARDYLWVAPAGLAMLVLVVLPFVTGATVSLFAYYDGTWTFVGFRHFLDILLARDWPVTSPMSFLFTLGVTVLWTVTNVALHVAIGVALALLLREPWIRLRAMWRALLILPWAIPNYITALIWKGMFHAEFGAINALIGFVLGHGGPVKLDWFSSFTTAFGADLITNTWLGFPFMMVVTLGALQAIPRDLEEAAEVDGAGWWLRFRHVVWPLLRPALMPAVVLGSVWTFNMFNVIYLVSGGEPDGSTEILISEAYRWAFSRGNRYGYASAYAVLVFAVLLLYTRAANRLVGKKVF